LRWSIAPKLRSRSNARWTNLQERSSVSEGHHHHHVSSPVDVGIPIAFVVIITADGGLVEQYLLTVAAVVAVAVVEKIAIMIIMIGLCLSNFFWV